jgi:hypothetical protein
MIKQITLAAVLLLLVDANAWGQDVQGVRGMVGGVGVLHELPGSGGRLYLDSQGSQGYMYSGGTFESYNFRIPNGPAWSGSMMTLGPRLTVGLISGANQGSFSSSSGTIRLSGSPTVIPSIPRDPPPVPEIQSSILLDIP